MATGSGKVAQQIIDAGVPQTVKVSIPSAQVLTLGTIPVLAIPAPGAGKAIQLLGAFSRITNVTVPYDTVVNHYLQYDTAADSAMSDNGLLGSAFDNMGQMITVAGNGVVVQMVEDKSVYVTCLGVDPLNGDGDLDVYITYKIITL